MTQTLSDMTVSEAASKALELLIYSSYLGRIKEEPEWDWYTPYKGTFEEYIQDYLNDDADELDENEVEASHNLDLAGVWQSLMNEGKEGTKDGWTGKVEAEYGGEGQGDQYWMVISVSDGNTTRYFRRDGWYASYDGGYLDGDTYEVKPQEKTIVVYES